MPKGTKQPRSHNINNYTGADQENETQNNIEINCYPADIQLIQKTINNLIQDILKGEDILFIPESKQEVKLIDQESARTQTIKGEVHFWYKNLYDKNSEIHRLKAICSASELQKFIDSHPMVLDIPLVDTEGLIDKTLNNKRMRLILPNTLIEKEGKEHIVKTLSRIDKELVSKLHIGTPTEDTTVLVLGNIPIQPRGLSGRNNILIKASEIEDFENFSQVYIHERVHTLFKQMKKSGIKFYNPVLNEGIGNYLAISLLEEIGILDPQSKELNLREGFSNDAGISSSILDSLKEKRLEKNPKAEYETLQEFWKDTDKLKSDKEEKNEEEIQESLKLQRYYYEFGQTFVEVFIDSFKNEEEGMKRFLSLYDMFYDARYKELGTFEKFETALAEKEYKKDFIDRVLSATTNRILLKSMKGKKLFDYLISLEIDELKIILQNQELHVVLGILKESPADRHQIKAKDIIGHLEESGDPLPKIQIISLYFQKEFMKKYGKSLELNF